MTDPVYVPVDAVGDINSEGTVVEGRQSQPVTTPKGPRFAEIPIDKIRLADGRARKSFDKNDEKNQHFVDSVRRSGVLQPIDVREVGDHYELVFGERRAWACRQLGLATVPAKISAWSDKQVAWVAMAENTFRAQLTPVQFALQMQKILKELDLMSGPDLGKAAGGLARSKNAGRDGNGRVVRESRIEPFIPDEGDISPATAAAAVAGEAFADGEESPMLGHASMLANTTGKTPNRTREDIKIANSFTQDQLLMLGNCDVSKDDLLKVARIEDTDTKNQVISLVLYGQTVDQSLAAVKVVTPEGAKAAAYFKEKEVPDKVWLETHCAECRNGLQNPAAFDRAALLYRHDRAERSVHKARNRDMVKKTKAQGWDPFSDLLGRLFWVEHPNSWYICRECRGRNVDNPECDGCRGAGFKLKFETPK